jgi:hypothetical protein
MHFTVVDSRIMTGNMNSKETQRSFRCKPKEYPLSLSVLGVALQCTGATSIAETYKQAICRVFDIEWETQVKQMDHVTSPEKITTAENLAVLPDQEIASYSCTHIDQNQLSALFTYSAC